VPQPSSSSINEINKNGPDGGMQNSCRILADLFGGGMQMEGKCSHGFAYVECDLD
jgi:hypothetical protein